MRILHIVPSLNKEHGGPSSSVPILCNSLGKAGIDATIFTTDWGAPNLPHNSAENNGIGKFYAIRYFHGKMLHHPHFLFSPDLIKALLASWREFHVINVHSLWNPIASISMQQLRKVGAKYCLTPGGMLDPIVISRH